MSHALGIANLLSVFVLTGVVASVYSVAQDAFLPTSEIARRGLRRAGKLLGVLIVLAVAVHFLAKIRG